MRRILCLIIFPILLLIPCRKILAQSSSAAIAGQVTDSGKAALPRATVTAINNNTNVRYQTKTNEHGSYVMPSLAPGEYRIEVERQGFKNIVKPDVILHVQDTVELNFEMAIGSVNETVTVQGGSPLVNTEDALLGETVTSRPVVNLPLNGRNVMQLAMLQPGVTETDLAPGLFGAGSGFQIGGAKADSVTYLLDGGLNNDLLNNNHDDMSISHDGMTLAFTTGPASHRHEGMKEYEIFLLETSGGKIQQLTHNAVSEPSISWSSDDKKLFFTTYGEAIGEYQHVQERIYAVDFRSGGIERWGATFSGAVGGTYQITSSGTLITTATSGVETQIYSLTNPTDELKKFAGVAGSYSAFSLASHSPKIAFIYSAWGKPVEVYLADDLEHLGAARPITKFNERFARYELPIGRTYKWKADDGTLVEGVLLYPPGKFGAKHLPTLTLIHGGPANTDGNRFRADWYDWAVLAAMRGYLVFRPNYRGSAGYGDAFLQEISPHIVSLPGRDILTGLDALVKDGIADPDKLSIAGYSYGGFLTNWLITQTTRFRAAMTGAGAVEHVMQWGNDDLPLGDSWYLKGMPWQSERNYNEEAAIFQIDKVKTPTHIVGGSLDIRVYIGEQFLLERALHMLDVPSKLLLFPGEGHLLTNNPWHGKIKVREELLWLNRYCPSENVLAIVDSKE